MGNLASIHSFQPPLIDRLGSTFAIGSLVGLVRMIYGLMLTFFGMASSVFFKNISLGDRGIKHLKQGAIELFSLGLSSYGLIDKAKPILPQIASPPIDSNIPPSSPQQHPKENLKNPSEEAEETLNLSPLSAQPHLSEEDVKNQLEEAIKKALEGEQNCSFTIEKRLSPLYIQDQPILQNFVVIVTRHYKNSGICVISDNFPLHETPCEQNIQRFIEKFKKEAPVSFVLQPLPPPPEDFELQALGFAKTHNEACQQIANELNKDSERVWPFAMRIEKEDENFYFSYLPLNLYRKVTQQKECISVLRKELDSFPNIHVRTEEEQQVCDRLIKQIQEVGSLNKSTSIQILKIASATFRISIGGYREQFNKKLTEITPQEVIEAYHKTLNDLDIPKETL